MVINVISLTRLYLACISILTGIASKKSAKKYLTHIKHLIYNRADGDPKVYSLDERDEGSGIAIKHHIEMTPTQFEDKGYDWNQVFIVNTEEKDYYLTGTPITY